MADKNKKYNSSDAPLLAVAPMMDWTDRHCRVFHRQFSRRALLYTEMVTGAALVRGGAEHLLALSAIEHPLALQLGGSDPAELAQAVRIAAPHGFGEINLNVGCPSDRVKSGCFGAVLMREPQLVGRIVGAMRDAAGEVEITVKCRLGVDEQDPEQALPALLRAVAGAGVRRVTVHARKAWLQGLNPKENREIPPLDYPLVRRIRDAFPQLWIGVNGGIATLDAAEALLAQGFDGVMIGRAAYHQPADVLGAADRRIFGDDVADVAPEDAVRAMLPYIEAECAAGTPLARITRHMLGAFAGRPGARRWRRMLSEGAHLPGAGPELVEAALAPVLRAAA
ncbi:tRNA dihydrouridine(20/20a) synthase DusA [Rhodobacteraceae bacterium 2CG4]|uniref:tRNA-dihydrouridine(20/20a) synthase n=1 Tax=Halovulum marinum TaxID=2662447 RepID=A0A6L5YWK6_9RHOB|nr:tRNA dihydrouridine(20/20a) synthase DusA [Halovulum marinum]MSU88628.1 tRNA dihydrouridine(20/20a) synthase DusA [Halovulum marinum]